VNLELPGTALRSGVNMKSMYSLLNRHLDSLLTSIEKDGGITEYKYLIRKLRSTNVNNDTEFQRVIAHTGGWGLHG
jgi:hypothetical protein